MAAVIFKTIVGLYLDSDTALTKAGYQSKVIRLECTSNKIMQGLGNNEPVKLVLETRILYSPLNFTISFLNSTTRLSLVV